MKFLSEADEETKKVSILEINEEMVGAEPKREDCEELA